MTFLISLLIKAAALRYNLHPPKSGKGTGVNQLQPEPPAVRVFCLGARARFLALAGFVPVS